MSAWLQPPTDPWVTVSHALKRRSNLWLKWPGTHQPLEVFCLKLFHSFTVLRECALKLNKQAQTCKYLAFCVSGQFKADKDVNGDDKVGYPQLKFVVFIAGGEDTVRTFKCVGDTCEAI